MENTKYPRTYHLPFSPGASSDDKRLMGDWFKYYKGKLIILTEKLDGENTCLCKRGVYARSHTSETRSGWSINLWDPRYGFYNNIKDLISDDEYLYGENLYGIHSIEYNKLENYWHLFAVRNSKRWYSWDEVVEFSNLLVVHEWSLEGVTVPELWRGTVNTESELKELVLKYAEMPSKYGDTREGIVVRVADSFPIDEFKNNVCKYVRANHVQTDKHWTETWKKAKLLPIR